MRGKKSISPTKTPQPQTPTHYTKTTYTNKPGVARPALAGLRSNKKPRHASSIFQLITHSQQARCYTRSNIPNPIQEFAKHMNLSIWTILIIFIVCVVLAFPLAILISAALGALVILIERLTIRCPSCNARKMRSMNWLRVNSTDNIWSMSFFLCLACGKRWLRINSQKTWEDASDPKYDHAYRPKSP